MLLFLFTYVLKLFKQFLISMIHSPDIYDYPKVVELIPNFIPCGLCTGLGGYIYKGDYHVCNHCNGKGVK